jgi:hypothetical protein
LRFLSVHLRERLPRHATATQVMSGSGLPKCRSTGFAHRCTFTATVFVHGGIWSQFGASVQLFEFPSPARTAAKLTSKETC